MRASKPHVIVQCGNLVSGLAIICRLAFVTMNDTWAGHHPPSKPCQASLCSPSVLKSGRLSRMCRWRSTALLMLQSRISHMISHRSCLGHMVGWASWHGNMGWGAVIPWPVVMLGGPQRLLPIQSLVWLLSQSSSTTSLPLSSSSV